MFRNQYAHFRSLRDCVTFQEAGFLEFSWLDYGYLDGGSKAAWHGWNRLGVAVVWFEKFYYVWNYGDKSADTYIAKDATEAVQLAWNIIMGVEISQ